MMRNRPFAWWFGLFLGGLVAASSGCYRPTVSPVADGLTAAEPSPHSAGEPEKAADDKKDADAPAFHFPDDAGGALLSRVLPPADVKGPLDEPNAGARRPSPSALDGQPTALPLPPTPPAPPPPPGEHARKTPAPHLVIDETLGTGRGDPMPPEPRSFYAGDRAPCRRWTRTSRRRCRSWPTNPRRIAHRWTTRPPMPAPRRRWRRRCRSARNRPRMSA